MFKNFICLTCNWFYVLCYVLAFYYCYHVQFSHWLRYMNLIKPLLNWIELNSSNLHWLPVNTRIAYKIDLLTYKSKAGLSSTYLSDLLYDYVPSRTLRSSSQSLLQLPRKFPSKSYGQRSFSYAAPSLWNNLPQQVRTADNVKRFQIHVKNSSV